MSKEIESGMKNHPSKKTPGPDHFIGKFYQTLKGLIPLFFKFNKN
jgi:hypothetical protein